MALLQKGVNRLISTAPEHSPQNGYFVPSDGRYWGGLGGRGGGVISEPPLSHLRPPLPSSSTSTIRHIYGPFS